MAELFLGVEGGGTRTTALLVDSAGRVVERAEAGPGNLRLISDKELGARFQEWARRFPKPRAVGVGLAGCRDEADHARLDRMLSAAWPGVPHRVTHDLETAWLAAFADGPKESIVAQIIVISGTGSCCYGRNQAGRVAKVGGWGHQLGDLGSAYDIAFTALREVISQQELSGGWPRLGARFLRCLSLNQPIDLIGWIQSATKAEIAALTPEVFESAKLGDALAKKILRQTQGALAEQALAAATRLVSRSTRNRTVEFVLCGSVFTRQPAAARGFGKRLMQALPASQVRVLSRDSVWGAVVLAQATAGGVALQVDSRASSVMRPDYFIPRTKSLSPTEQRNPRSLKLDRLSLPAAIALMLEEDRKLPGVIGSHARPLARLIRIVAEAFQSGGRLFYVGAGTSGRLGVLDASECPPTFRTSPDLVQGIMAGGMRALHSAVEGAEDDAEAGAAAVRARCVGRRDVVLGIAASGRTPFVWGALSAARGRQATTALLCFNPHLDLPRKQRPDVVLALDVGAEILTGSTRLKAGTATKQVLNILTTLAMVRIGKVIGNLMVDLNPSNEKLRDRAARIVVDLTGVPYSAAWQACEKANWNVGQAVKRARKS